MKALIAAKADVNMRDKDSYNALMRASMNGYTEIVKALIAAKADVNMRDKDGWTTLTWTSYNDNTETVNLFKEAGATK